MAVGGPAVSDERCPSCGVELGGQRVSTRYKGNLTIIRVEVPGEGDDAEPVIVEHVCGDRA